MANRIDIELGASDNLSPVVQRSVSNTEKEIQKLDRATDDAAKGAAALEREVEKLVESSDSAQVSVANVEKEVEKLNQAAGTAAKGTNALDKEVEKLSDGTVTAQRSVANAERETEKFKRTAGTTAKETNALQREVGKLTDANEFAAQGVQMFRSALQSIVWGSIIGGVTALTLKAFEWALATKDVTEENTKLLSTLDQLANHLDPLREKTEAYSRAQFQMNAIQMQMEQLRARQTLPGLQAELEHLKALGEGQIGVIEAFKLFFTLTGSRAENMQALADRTEDYNLKAKLMEVQIAQLTGVINLQIPTFEEWKSKIAGITLTTIPEWMIGTQNVNAGLDAQARFLRQIIDLEEYLSGLQPPLAATASLPQDLEREAEERLRIEREVNAEIIRIRQTTFAASAFMLNQLAFLFEGTGKRSFQWAKAVNIAQSLMNTYQAATRALAEGGPFAGPGLAAAITALGLAQVAKIASTEIGSRGGGGGAGSIGGAGGGTPTGGLRGAPEEQGQTIEIYPTINALNPETVDWDAVWQAAGDSLGRYLQRGGRTGNVQIEFKRN
jgi:hypothetical protein